MKRLFFLSVLCCLFSLTASAQSQSTGKHNGHEWVDLGLSVKWAKCNIGASASSDYGTYFAWGDALYDDGVCGQYWCSTPEYFDDYTFSLAGAICFAADDKGTYLCARFTGFTIRPVFND